MSVGGVICCALHPLRSEVAINGVIDHEVKSSTSVIYGAPRPFYDGQCKKHEVNNIDVIMS